jgi:outer membrane protein assembly factor BamE (lipoprotein component of BamABCDE complex)
LIQSFGRFPRAGALARMGLLTVMAAALSGCFFATIDSQGYVPDEGTLERVKPGAQTREDIAQMLGTPSSVLPFSDDTWIYISRKVSTVAFLDPRVLEQNVVVVQFDQGGIVQDVRRYTLEDGKPIDPVTRKTPSPGKELTFLDQLIGNIGRFNPTDKKQ